MKIINTSFFTVALISTLLITIHNDPVEAQSSIQWVDLEKAQTQSVDDKKTVFVFVEAEWCGFCKQMKREVFPVKEISSLMSDEFHGVLIDLESKNEISFNGNKMTEREFARSMEVMQTPTMIFLNSAGDELGRQPGYLNEDEFFKLLRYVNSDEFGVVSFSDFSAGK